MKKLTAAVLISLMVAACASSPKTNPPQAPQPEAIPKPQTETVPQAPAQEAITGKPKSQVETESEKLAAQLQDLGKKSVFFDFDKFNVEPMYQEIIQQQAEFIQAHKNETVTLEGNADERGSNEYNLALGNRRAESVRKSLELLGIPAEQIKTVSWGEEKPRLTCHEEQCWKENRRVDFVHKLNP